MWFPVVKLARMWEFDGIHKYAIKNMPYNQIRKTSAEKVALALKYDIQLWLLPGLNELAQRKEPLGNHDLELLGPEVVLKVAAVRESLAISNRSGAYNDGCSGCGSMGGASVRNGRCKNCGRACSTNDYPRHIAGSRDASEVDFTSVVKRVFQISG
jgi:hypothetical protein